MKTNRPVNEENVKILLPRVEEVFEEYKLIKDTIVRGWLSEKTINWLEERFHAKNLSNEQLNELWFAIEDVFDNLTIYEDETGEHWKTLTADEMIFYRDTDSAWKEYVNAEARSRR